MSNTTFVNQTTVIVAEWLNDVNGVVYNVLGNGTTVPATAADARNNLGLEIGVDIPSLTGTGSSGTWPINITGSAASASNLVGTLPISSGGTGQTSASSAFTALKQNASETVTGVVELASTAEAQAGTDVLVAMTPARVKEAQIQLGTALASTSGTSLDFTGIPSWAKRVTIFFDGVSTNGTSQVQVQLGSGSVQTTGYISQASWAGPPSGTTTSASTTGLHLASSAAVSSRIGLMTIQKMSGNKWVASHSYGDAGGTVAGSGGGVVTLSGTLDRARITTINGTDVFDAGAVNISWE